MTTSVSKRLPRSHRLIPSNPSQQKHYFSSDAFSQAVCTNKGHTEAGMVGQIMIK